MPFEIRDKLANNSIRTNPEDFYINGIGQIFRDCDPHGVCMSGKRKISGVDSNRFSVEAVHSTFTNTESTKCETCNDEYEVNIMLDSGALFCCHCGRKL